MLDARCHVLFSLSLSTKSRNILTDIKLTCMLVLWPVFSLCFLSCTGNKRRDNIAQVVKEWMGKEIRFPDGLTCTHMGKDTACIDLYSESYKILLYVDSAGCTSCRLNLFDWKSIIKESDTTFIRKPEFLVSI